MMNLFGKSLHAAALLSVVGAVFAQQTVAPEIYGAVHRGVVAADGANAGTELGVGAWGEGNPGETSGAGYQASTQLRFSCSSSDQTRSARTGSIFKMRGQCDENGITLARCDMLTTVGRTCKTDEWGPDTVIGSGASSTMGDATVSAACTAAACDVVVAQRGTTRHDTRNLESAGASKMASTRASGGAAATISDTAVSEDFLAYRRTDGARLSQCQNRVTGAADTGRIVDCSGNDRGPLTFDGMECGERCIGETESTYINNESCQATVPTDKQFCQTEFGQDACFEQPVAETRGCTENFLFNTRVCTLTRDEDGEITDSCDRFGETMADWNKENIFDRQYDGHELRSWKQGYSRPRGWFGECDDSGGCADANIVCTDTAPRTASDGVVVDYPCFKRERTLECPTGATASSCDANDEAGACNEAQGTCESILDMDVQECHFERLTVSPAFVCPTGMELDAPNSLCFEELNCPAGYTYNPSTRACEIGADDGCDANGNAPGRPGVNITSVTVNGGAPAGAGWIDDSNLQIGFYSDSEKWCGTPKIIETRFDIDGGVETMKHFHLYYSQFDDSGIVELNGTPILSRNWPNCGGNVGQGSHAIEAVHLLKDTGNVLTVRVLSDNRPIIGSVRFAVIRHCTATAACRDGLTAGQDDQCVTEAIEVGEDRFQTQVKAACPSDYELSNDEQTCRLDESVCEASVDAVGPAQPILDITRSELIHPAGSGGGVTPLNPSWDAAGRKLRLYHQQGHGTAYCSDGWRMELDFDVNGGAEQISEFFARELRFDDNVRLELNGQEIYSSGIGCDNDTGTITRDIDENLARALMDSGNRLVITTTSVPDNLVMDVTLHVGRACELEPENREFVDLSACEAESPTCPDDYPCSQFRQYDFDCGYHPNPETTCDEAVIAGGKFESRYNEVTDPDSGDLISWDEAYSFNEQTLDYPCREDRQGSTCMLVETHCEEPDQKEINGAIINRECFRTVRTYDCKSGYNQAQCEADPVASDCGFSHTACIAQDGNGECVNSASYYVCENTGTSKSCNARAPSGSECTSPKTECAETTPGGVCTKEVETQDCYSGNPDQCIRDDACTLVGTSCTQTDPDTGICTRQQQDYECERTQITCESVASVCSSNPPGSPFGEGFNAAMAAYAKMDALVSESNLDPSSLRIMSGEPAECTDSDGGSVVGAECCDLDADDESTFGDACDEEEQKLAAGRRAHRAHYIGDYCKTRIPLIGCVQDAETYCLFDSMLARIIHEQGRPQLNAMSTAPAASVTQQTMTFDFMNASPGWNTSVTVQGLPVLAWTWDQACEQTESVYASQNTPCPIRDEFFLARCNGESCPVSAIPAPYGPPSDLDWDLVRFEASGTSSQVLDNNADAGGECVENENAPGGYGGCEVVISSWPRGVSGDAQLAVDISWQLFRSEGVTTGWSTDTRRSGRFRFQPFQIERTNGFEMTETIPFRIQIDDGPEQEVTIPTVIPPGGVDLGTVPSSTIYGECDPQQNWCRMKVTTRVDLRPRPWCPGGDCPRKSSLDCDGFTIEEFMALDFDKMDLSEYTSRVSPNLPAADVMLAATNAGATQFESDYKSGQERDSTGSGTDHLIYITPTDGRGPWTTRAKLARQVQTRLGALKVERININWGDGRSDRIDPDDYTGAPEVEHTYSVRSDREYEIVAVFTLENGEAYRTRSVVRSWDENAPLDHGPYGGGQGGGGQYTPDESPSGYRGRQAPPAHYAQ